MQENPEYLWHGSPKKIEGDTLLPRKAQDLKNVPENVQVGVYASDNRDMAIAMALLKSEGMRRGSLSFDRLPVQGIAYEGWPTQEHVNAYKLPSETFQETKEKGQWVSSAPVQFVSVEELSVKDVIYLIRKPTQEERVSYEQRFKVKLKD